MGCGGSQPAAQPAQPAQQTAEPAPVTGTMVESQDRQVAPAAGQGKGKGKGGKGKGKGKGAARWQIWLDNKWKDYENPEDGILKRAFMMGHKNAKFSLRDQKYEYNFKKMKQINKKTGKERAIRPPPKFLAPKKPLLPEGPMTIITVKPNQAGTLVDIKDPNNPGKTVKVYVPPHAKPGQKLAVPLPQAGEDVAAVQQKQDSHDKQHGIKTSANSWSTGGKVAAGGAALGAAAAVGVGGVILGDHLAGGELAETIGAEAVDAGEALGEIATDVAGGIGDWAPGAADDAGDWLADAAGAAGEWLEGAAGDAGVWAEGAGEDAGAWAEGAGEDAGDWLGDAGEDAGDFVMDLF